MVQRRRDYPVLWLSTENGQVYFAADYHVLFTGGLFCYVIISIVAV